jgi:hypothetical protein
MEDYERGSHTVWTASITLYGRRSTSMRCLGATDEVWKRYIEEQKPPEPDDAFNVV